MPSSQQHILYVEDHADTRDLVTLILTTSNYRVTTTHTITHALKLTREQHFDLYLLDAWLPDGTGIELCQKVRQSNDQTPIMFLSGLAYEADKQAALDHGAQCYLVKPTDIQVLRQEVSALIGLGGKYEHPEGSTRRPSPLVERLIGQQP